MIGSPRRLRARPAPMAHAGLRNVGVTMGRAAFLLAHVPLGLAVYRDARLATAHALASVVIGLIWATHGTRKPERAAYVAAYIVGGEVLWRMTGAHIAWEFGKYGVIGVLALWMITKGRLAGPVMSTLYFALLVPSALLTLMAFDLGLARQQISFNLSGPITLMIAVWFFAQIRMSPHQRQGLYVAAIAPVIGVASITFLATVLNPDIAFGSESNMEASGGFGPNQVSAMLGLGALLALLGIAEDEHGSGFKPLMVGCIIVLAVQSALTFSRGGLYNAGAAAVVGAVYFVRDARTRFKAIGAGVLLGLLGYYVIFPALDRFTDGALSSRFSDTGLTNRDSIVEADLAIFQDHLLVGVGPGLGNEYRAAYVRNTPAHTEYSRMLAEHGLLGLASLAALAALILQTMRQPRPLRESAVMIALFAWGLLFMLSYGMRVAAPSFVIGLACMPTSLLPTTLPLAQRPLRRGVVVSMRARPARRWAT